MHSFYQQYPKQSWISFIGIGYLFFLSIISSSITLSTVLYPSIISVIGIILFVYPKRSLIFVLITSALLVFLSFVEILPIKYGTFSFLVLTFVFFERLNLRKSKQSILTQLTSGDFRLAKAVIMSTFVLGLVVEFVNLPFGIWEYHIPVNTKTVFGIPAIIAAFGWTPWTMCILSVFEYFKSE